MTGPRIFGLALSMVGVVVTLFPHWFAFLTQAAEPTADLYEAVERRVRGGMVLGVGLAFVAVPSLRPWSSSVPTSLLYVVLGALVARLFGMVVDGAVPRQWMLVAAEGAIIAVLAVWMWRAGGPTG